MKRSALILAIVLPFALFAGGPNENKPFVMGEELQFRAYYHAWIGNLTAGYATFKVNESMVNVDGNKTYHIRSEGKTRRAFNWFFKVSERFETWMHPEELVPLKSLRRTREGDFEKDEDYVFDHKNNIVTSTRAVTEVPPNTHDVISALYYARFLDFSQAVPGQTFPIDVIIDDRVHTSVIVYEGIDTIDVELGTFACYKFRPKVIKGGVFDEEYPMTLWVSADENKVPILAESDVLVGDVRLELISYKNLANPMHAGLVLND